MYILHLTILHILHLISPRPPAGWHGSRCAITRAMAGLCRSHRLAKRCRCSKIFLSWFLNKESESGWFVQRWGGKQFHTSWHCCLTLYQSYADVYLYFVFWNLSPRLKSSHQVTVRKKTVDATRMETKVPSTTKPNFTVEVNFTIVHVHQNCSSNIKPNRMESTLFLSTASPESQNPGRGEN